MGKKSSEGRGLFLLYQSDGDPAHARGALFQIQTQLGELRHPKAARVYEKTR